MRRHCDGKDENLVMPTLQPELRAKVMQAIGEGSMCWTDVAEAGTFDSTKASEIGERLIRDLALGLKLDVIFAPCDCGLSFDDVSRSTLFPHRAF